MVSQKKNSRKRGGRDHFTGFKRLFLEDRASDFQRSQDVSSKEVGSFYDQVTTAFVRKYGGSFTEVGVNPDEDPVDPGDFDEEDTFTAAEAENESENYKKLRKVSLFLFIKRILLT